MRTLFVGNLDVRTTEGQVRLVFAAHGQIDSVKIARDPASGRSRGVAFVKMCDASLALTMSKSMTGTMIDGRSIRVSLLSRNT